MEVSQIVALYKKMLQNDGELRRLNREISSGNLAALQQYGIRAGQLSVDALQKGTADGIADQNSIIQILDGVFRENYQAVANASQTALKAANQAAGLGLNGSESDFVSTAAQIADRLSGYDDIREGLNSLTNDIVLQSQRYADDSERRSAEFASDSGLEVLVTREYDNVGVHTTDKGGGEVCQWCLDRCGTDVPYQEAYDRGMFERHPGCGCIITYKTKKGKFRQGKGDWEHNQWAETTNSERENRIIINQYYAKTGQMTPDEYARYKRELSDAANLEKKQITLSKPEYAKVMSELNNNLSDEDRKHAIVYKAIGNYRYKIINKGFDDYVIIGKKKL